ncbi:MULTISPECIES: methylaspartate mutase accessory protein GlmL [Peptoniphilus]|uniref:methylaspartate mutase accessory protein GlmL n=1 Tax=Peptoniphilus TaxID=162289 RepID=UPI000288DD20|nr:MULTISPECIES: methylaspartate mutase accessory protein GlmL [Peptoniphilus]MBS6610306.1 glutamate mutase L [Peptoniphilus harei]MDU1043667.1 methylaspartate mutase accessory protein GlmL [Peptoniphilus rhinitidis]MDU1954506.1 methylaspartate mutase accessory protein GlmL [Peptoniphilus lacydonensis]MDU2109294.1 methylaspartate mutase accessory protein GlmL [Peptoniphilus lacydonensis]MDU2115453.1 methylaspartate mutase accessory protein GlmL [Peptoniphilus lacydonensis]
MIYLLVDVGSTYTKLNLVDTEKNEILGSASSYTTVETDVREGFNKAYEKLSKKTDVKYDKILGCSSASGGLKVVAIGFSKNLTTNAARLASLSSGARILKVYSYELSLEDVEEIKNSGADIIVLCGGTDHGNRENIIFNAKKLAQESIKIPIVVAGNIDTQKYIKEIFYKKGVPCEFTENVMPTTNTINYKPLRNAIGNIFIKTIAHAKGIDLLSENFEVLLPTPIAVQKAMSVYAKYLGKVILSVDIGGATTDIHSIGKTYYGEENVISPPIDEPFEKRTVEGDMGMRYSATALYESVGDEPFLKFGINDAKEKVEYRFFHTDYVPDNDEDLFFDNALCYIATKTSLERHIGHIKKIETPTRTIYKQYGKDLRPAEMFIGTGGSLINSDDPKKILSAIGDLDDKYLINEDIKYYLDEKYILSSAGLISTVDEKASYELLNKYLKEL